MLMPVASRAIRLARGSFNLRRYATTSDAPAGGPLPLVLNFALPHASFYKDTRIHQANIPAVSGDMGILAAHVPIVDQIKPGIVEIITQAGAKPEKFFVSGGFVTVTPDSTINIAAVEGAKLADLDLETARRQLEEAQRSDDPVEKIESEIYQAMVTALSANK